VEEEAKATAKNFGSVGEVFGEPFKLVGKKRKRGGWAAEKLPSGYAQGDEGEND